MKSFLLEVLLIAQLSGYAGNIMQLKPTNTTLQRSVNNVIKQPIKYHYKIIGNYSSGFGYDILRNGRTLIHQPSIPAVAGMRSFATKEDAIRVAQLLIRKLKKGEQFPSVSARELTEMQIKLAPRAG